MKSLNLYLKKIGRSDLLGEDNESLDLGQRVHILRAKGGDVNALLNAWEAWITNRMSSVRQSRGVL